MAFRGTESPMDFEWQGYGPVDPNSPFHKLAMENQRKRTHAALESPIKPLPPLPKNANTQSWVPHSPAPATQASPFRTPSFTTPRKPVDFDFSSGPESSPVDLADTEDTPDGKPPVVEFTGISNKRNSLFGLYGRFAPSPGRGEIKKSYNNAIAKRMLKKRRRAQNFEKQLVSDRRPSEDTSDDEARPLGFGQNIPMQQGQPKVHEVGWIASFFTFIHTYPDAPSIIAKYLQVFFNAAILGGCLYMFYSFYATIRADVDRASNEATAEVLADMAACTKNYVENRCGADTRLPALETICNNWELCMNQDPAAVKRARLSAHTFAEIFNSFVEPISFKTMIFTFSLVALGLFVNNATFTLYRRSQEHHATESYRQTSGSYIHPGPQMIGGVPSTPGTYRQQFPGWPNEHALQHDQNRLEYQRSPSKEQARSRSRSPEKKRIMI